MASRLDIIFDDLNLVEKIQRRLPYLFQLAELESSRAGKTGMEVGSLRERILVAMLIYKFGEANVETEIPITKSEVDLKLFGEPVSIKTISGKSYSGVKLIWTVDTQKAVEFSENYTPHCDMLLTPINWDSNGGLFYIPVESQKNLFNEMGRQNYIKLPKQGTNPRGVEITREALSKLVIEHNTKSVLIEWKRTEINFSPYKQWVDFWKED